LFNSTISVNIGSVIERSDLSYHRPYIPRLTPITQPLYLYSPTPCICIPHCLLPTPYLPFPIAYFCIFPDSRLKTPVSFVFPHCPLTTPCICISPLPISHPHCLFLYFSLLLTKDSRLFCIPPIAYSPLTTNYSPTILPSSILITRFVPAAKLSSCVTISKVCLNSTASC